MRKNGKSSKLSRSDLLGGAAAIAFLLVAFLFCPRMERNICSCMITPKPTFEKENLLDINTATLEQLQELPGIGPVLASRILVYRETHGRFQYLYELTDVEGIGSFTYEKLQDFITIGY